MAQQQRAIHTRQTILEAAAKVFDERGYASATMAEILKQADVTKGAFYFHFAHKYVLAAAVMEEQRRFLPGSDVSDSPLQDAIDLTQAVARRLQEDVVLRASIRLVIEQGSFSTPNAPAYLMWIEALRELLVKARAKGEVRDSVDVDSAAELIIGSFTGIQLMDQVLTGRRDLPRKISNLWRFLLPGLATPERLPGLDLEGAGS